VFEGVLVSEGVLGTLSDDDSNWEWTKVVKEWGHDSVGGEGFAG